MLSPLAWSAVRENRLELFLAPGFYTAEVEDCSEELLRQQS